MNGRSKIYLIFVFLFFTIFFTSLNVKSCKDIIACGDATEGEYNLLLKVRDPSRPDLQVLCIVPEGYEYVYHHPWTGKQITYKVEQKMIGVCSKEDIPPNIFKAGMSLNAKGIAYGDADSNSAWVNPTRNAWDDFDWIRYSSQKADTEEEAVELLTKDLVKKMHAVGVSENLFVVGPKKGYVIEADAIRYRIKEIDNGIFVMTNYPKELWKTQIIKTLPISSSFDTIVEKYVRNKESVRLKSLFGIRVVEISDDYISVRPISFFHAMRSNSINTLTKIETGQEKTVGYFRVELLEIKGERAKIRVKNIYYAWEEKMIEKINPSYGNINIKDMINWSRLDRKDLDGLRPMCEENRKYEAVSIYKIPEKNYEELSSGWFSSNHASSSIYVPFHICNDHIYEPYESGQAAQLSLELFEEYDQDLLSENFSIIEDIFINEIDEVEEISNNLLKKGRDISDFITIFDIGMQKQAFLTQEMWLEISKMSEHDNKQTIEKILSSLWKKDYVCTLQNMKDALIKIKNMPEFTFYKEKIIDISLNICKTKIEGACYIGKKNDDSINLYKNARGQIKQGKYKIGFDNLIKSFKISDGMIENNQIYIENINKEKSNQKISIYLLFFLVFIGLILIFSRVEFFR